MLEEFQMEQQVRATRRVGIYGDQLVMSAIGACLQEKPEFDVQKLQGFPADLSGKRDTVPLDVILFDLAATRTDFAISFIRMHPSVTVIGVDLANNRILVLSREQSRQLTEENLVQAIQAAS
jgi:hypothetical protein